MSIAVNIKQAAEWSGLPIKTIRYYEDIGLIKPLRSANGYRAFQERDLHNLNFLAKARGLGFTIEECRTLLALYHDKSRASADVKSIARKHLVQIDEKITELEKMHRTLRHLINHCAGDTKPECPIIDELSGELGAREIQR